MSTIMPVPTKNLLKKKDLKKVKTVARQVSDSRPVAFTLVIVMCMERFVSNQLITSVADRMDSLQFAYSAKRGVEDVTLTLFNLI